MTDLSTLAALMQKGAAHPNPASFQSGMDAAYSRGMLKQLISAQLESAKQDNEFKAAQAEQQRSAINVANQKLPFEIQKILAEVGEKNAQTKGHLVSAGKTEEETTDLKNTRMVEKFRTGLRQNKPDLNLMADLVDSGVIDVSLLNNYMSAKGPKAKAEQAQLIEQALVNNLSHTRAQQLQAQKDAADMERARVSAQTGASMAKDGAIKAAIRNEIAQWVEATGKQASEHPKYGLLEASIPRQQAEQQYTTNTKVAELTRQRDLFKPDHPMYRALDAQIKQLQRGGTTTNKNPLYQQYKDYLQ